MQRVADRVVVTGGAGFIGSHLVDRLLASGRGEVVVVDDLSRGRLEHLAGHRADPRLRFVEADVRDSAALTAALRGARLVFHLAARSLAMGGDEDEDETFSSNVVGTFNVLRVAAQVGVKHVVFTSARDVYGEPIALPVDEDHPLMAINTYGASKAAGEVYCRAFRRKYGLQVVILRLGNVYGPRDAGHAIPVWVEQAMAGETLHVRGGKEIIDFLWVDQAVEALVRAAAVDGSLPPINVASGTGTRILDLARRIVRLTDGRSRIAVLPPDERGVTRFVANVDRMRQLLRLEPPLDPLANLPHLLPAPAAAALAAGG
jgi:nucleoside-diphosphate-sugar epimerase